MHDRINSEGIPRHTLPWVLTQARFVRDAVRMDYCLLCRAGRVNEAGLCLNCMTYLNDEELNLVERWCRGTGP